MYTLRRILENGIEMNFSLGDCYNLIHLERNPEEFKKEFKDFWKMNYEKEHESYAFINSERGEIIPLNKNDFNFIMTDSGKTFSNLTFK